MANTGLFAFFASVLGWGVAKVQQDTEDFENEVYMKGNTKTNAPLQKEYRSIISRKVYAEAREYESRGEKESTYLPKMYHKYGIPMSSEAKKCAWVLFVPPDDITNLITQITKKYMYRLGYAYSERGRNSAWQEREKSVEVEREMLRQYPWY